MSVSERLFGVFRGHPLLLVVTAGSFTGAIFLSYRNIVKPHLDRRKRQQIERDVQVLYELEAKRHFAEGTATS